VQAFAPLALILTPHCWENLSLHNKRGDVRNAGNAACSRKGILVGWTRRAAFSLFQSAFITIGVGPFQGFEKLSTCLRTTTSEAGSKNR
jgi:hypothetical protein